MLIREEGKSLLMSPSLSGFVLVSGSAMSANTGDAATKSNNASAAEYLKNLIGQSPYNRSKNIRGRILNGKVLKSCEGL
jgi:hypothetical protein